MDDNRGADKKCNGWTNHETWLVKLWLDNERESYFYWSEEARNRKGRPDANVELAEQLRREIDEDTAVELSGLYSDLLNAALSEVNWQEIAEDFLDDVADEWTGEPSSCDAPPMPTTEESPDEGPQENLTESLFGDVISRYTRAQAIEDGVLVDVTEAARKAGFKLPVAVTRGVWARYVEVPDGVECQDEDGRLWDVLWMTRHAIRQSDADASEIRVQLHVRNDNQGGEPPLVTLKAVCGPSDDASPRITIMLPEED